MNANKLIILSLGSNFPFFFLEKALKIAKIKANNKIHLKPECA